MVDAKDLKSDHWSKIAGFPGFVIRNRHKGAPENPRIIMVYLQTLRECEPKARRQGCQPIGVRKSPDFADLLVLGPARLGLTRSIYAYVCVCVASNTVVESTYVRPMINPGLVSACRHITRPQHVLKSRVNPGSNAYKTIYQPQNFPHCSASQTPDIWCSLSHVRLGIHVRFVNWRPKPATTSQRLTMERCTGRSADITVINESAVTAINLSQ